MEDLSGKLIIKVALGDDIRRIPIHNEVTLSIPTVYKKIALSCRSVVLNHFYLIGP